MTIIQFTSFFRNTVQGFFSILQNYIITVDGINISIYALFLGGVTISVFIGVISVILRK